MPASIIYIAAHGYFLSFKFPFYSVGPSNSHTTAAYKIKASSFQYINITQTKFICSAIYVCD